jgi:hypothetical protein
MRVIVWKRMTGEELLWIKKKERQLVERLAEKYDMPLH